MSGYARIRIMGKAGEDPVKKTANGKDFVRLSIGCNDAEYKGKTEWFKAIFWGKLVDVCIENVAKGSLIEVHGLPHLNVWQDQHGRTFQKIQIRVKEIYFVSTPRKRAEYNPDEKL